MKRVLVLLEQRANADLLANYLGAHYEVILLGADQPWPDAFDIGIVDGATLDRIELLVKRRRAAEHPVLLPFLMVTARRDVGLTTHHVWHNIDELIFTPIQKLELQVRVEILLRARELSLVNSRIVNAAGEGILGLDLAGRITAANPTAQLLLGSREHELIGRSVAELLDSPDVDSPLAAARMEVHRALRTATAIRQRNGALRQSDGTVIPVDYVLTPIESGNPAAGAVLLFGDQSELQRLNDNLEQKVIARTRDLLTANAELESFAAMVSHDLRGPLRTVNGFSHSLQEDYRDRLDSDGQFYLDRIIAATNRMSGIIDGMLRLSRVTRSELNRTRVDLSQLARLAAQSVTERYPGREVTLHIAEGLTADADPLLVRTLLENLLDNAWKYTARTAAPVVEVSGAPGKGARVFCVRDNGAGFDMQDAGKLFKPFQRLHDPGEFAGYGVGLAIVHRVVARHDGRAWGEGAVGQGAAFYFTLGPAPASPD